MRGSPNPCIASMVEIQSLGIVKRKRQLFDTAFADLIDIVSGGCPNRIVGRNGQRDDFIGYFRSRDKLAALELCQPPVSSYPECPLPVLGQGQNEFTRQPFFLVIRLELTVGIAG